VDSENNAPPAWLYVVGVVGWGLTANNSRPACAARCIVLLFSPNSCATLDSERLSTNTAWAMRLFRSTRVGRMCHRWMLNKKSRLPRNGTSGGNSLWVSPSANLWGDYSTPLQGVLHLRRVLRITPATWATPQASGTPDLAGTPPASTGARHRAGGIYTHSRH